MAAAKLGRATSGAALPFLLPILLAVLAGCSMVRLGYGQLDTIAAWRAEQYFDLDSAQKEDFLRRFRPLHDWHRREQLPDYAAFLDQFGARVQKGLASADVHWLVSGVRARYAAIAERGANDAAALLTTVTPAQLEALQRRFDRDNRSFIREHRLDSGPEERQRARVRRALAQLRDWVGTLAPEQERRIEAMARALPEIEPLRHEERMRRQREFLELMRQRADAKAFETALRRWLIDWESDRPPEHRRVFDESWKQRAEFYAAVDRMLTREQREHFISRLQAHSQDFRRLAGAAAPPQRTAAGN
jgi:hypothetical protein